MSGLIDDPDGLAFGEGLEFLDGLGSPLGLNIILTPAGQYSLFWGEDKLYWGVDPLVWGP